MLPVFGQTKADYLACLELMFSNPKFEAAYNNSYDANGAFVILSGERIFNRNNRPPINSIQQSLLQDDFFDSEHIVKVVREDDLEALGIPEYSVLNIRPAGNDTQIIFQVNTTIRDESLQYMYDFKFEKVDEEWEVTATNVRTQRAVVTDW